MKYHWNSKCLCHTDDTNRADYLTGDLFTSFSQDVRAKCTKCGFIRDEHFQKKVDGEWNFLCPTFTGNPARFPAGQ